MERDTPDQNADQNLDDYSEESSPEESLDWSEIDTQCSEDDARFQPSLPSFLSHPYCPKVDPQLAPRSSSLTQSIQAISPVFSQERDTMGDQIPQDSVEHLEKIESENQRKPILLQIRGITPPEIRLPKILPSRIR
jgi:hypothetical protein